MLLSELALGCPAALMPTRQHDHVPLRSGHLSRLSRRVDGGELVVDRVPLALAGGKLVLAEPVRERVVRQLEGRGFVGQAKVGDTVSIHWGWACEVLTATKLERLERYSRYHLAIANQTI